MKGYIYLPKSGYYINVEHIVAITQDDICKDCSIIRTSSNDIFYCEVTVEELFDMIKKAKEGGGNE